MRAESTRNSSILPAASNARPLGIVSTGVRVARDLHLRPFGVVAPSPYGIGSILTLRDRQHPHPSGSGVLRILRILRIPRSSFLLVRRFDERRSGGHSAQQALCNQGHAPGGKATQ